MSRIVDLPAARTSGGATLAEVLAKRRSRRHFGGAALTLGELAQLLWAGQGITRTDGRRTAPSAGALYPMRLYAVAGAIAGVRQGLYRYRPDGHRLEACLAGDLRSALVSAAWQQDWMLDAAAILVIAAVPAVCAVKYGERADRYVLMEAGHIAENICLQAVALELAATPVGAYRDEQVSAALRLAADETACCLVPVGRARGLAR
jgi:SagB-type dehydrogenase family enzyme